jgi:hypothetical protein
MRPTVVFLQLVSPILLGAILLALALAAPALELQVLLPLGGPFVILSHAVDNPTTTRLLLFSLALVCFSWPAFRNYSPYFPTYMKSSIYFDAKGILETLDSFSPAEREHIGIASDWRNYHCQYLDRLNARRADPQFENTLYPLPSYVVFAEDMYGFGEFAYRVVRTRGLQQYHLAQAGGYVQYVFGHEGHSCKLWTVFMLKDTADAHFGASLLDVYLRYTKTVTPWMREYVPTAPCRLQFIDDVLTATKIRFFPIPALGNTLFLVDKTLLTGSPNHATDRESRSMIPIAYGVYTTD